jgi:hypothetical protein
MMNAKANSIGTLAGEIATSRIVCLSEARSATAIATGMGSGDLALSAAPRLRLVLHSARDRAGEVWETFICLVLWFSSIVAIGVCLG